MYDDDILVSMYEVLLNEQENWYWDCKYGIFYIIHMFFISAVILFYAYILL